MGTDGTEYCYFPVVSDMKYIIFYHLTLKPIPLDMYSVYV